MRSLFVRSFVCRLKPSHIFGTRLQNLVGKSQRQTHSQGGKSRNIQSDICLFSVIFYESMMFERSETAISQS